MRKCLFILALLLVAGCSSLTSTFKEIKGEPAEFAQEVKGGVDKLDWDFDPTTAGITALAMFLRRLYANHKREQARAKDNKV